MSFIGIVSNKKCFEKVKEELEELSKKYKNNIDDKLNLIHITTNSIKNLKNIRFETIIIEEDLKKFVNYKNTLRVICENAKFIVINTDINKKYDDIKKNEKINITYGLNQTADMTISSINDINMLICCQKNIQNKKGELIEIHEKRMVINKNKRLKVYEILIIYSIFSLYGMNIMDELLEK